MGFLIIFIIPYVFEFIRSLKSQCYSDFMKSNHLHPTGLIHPFIFGIVKLSVSDPNSRNIL